MSDKNNNKNSDIIDCTEFVISKNNFIFCFKIIKKKYKICIKYNNYEIELNNGDLQLLTKSVINNNNEAYKYIIELFKENKVELININDKEIKLLLSIYKYNRPYQFFLDLSYKDKDKRILGLHQKNTQLQNEKKVLIEKLKAYQNEIINLKQKNEELSKLKTSNIKNNSNINENKEILSCNLTNDSYSHDNLDNTFAIFKSIYDELILIYTNKNNSIISYNIIANKKIKEIVKSHEAYITNIRHFWDKINSKDLIMSISCSDNNLKVWEFPNFECILNIKNIYQEGGLDSACIFNYNNKKGVFTSNDIDESLDDKEIVNGPIKEFDFNGNLIKEINDSNYRTFFIDTYHDKKTQKIFIITGNEGFIQSYDYINNKKYHEYIYTYSDNGGNNGHVSIIINTYKDILALIESCWDGNLRIWNFYSGELITKIKINCLQGICISNNNKYLFIGCQDDNNEENELEYSNIIRVIELKTGKIITSLYGHNNEILTLKKIVHPQRGECLISQGAEDDQIKIWSLNDIFS